MFINLTLMHLTSSNFLPSPLISGSLIKPLIRSSYFSKSFSHLTYLSDFYQFEAYSTYFLHFLKTPLKLGSQDIIVYTCYLIKDIDIRTNSMWKVVLFRLCVFDNTQNFVSGYSITMIDISKSIFKNGNGEIGVDLPNCNEIYISKTVFIDCNYNKSIINAPQIRTFTLQDSEVKNCNSEHCIFDLSNKISKAAINFNNFINVKKYIFSSSSFTISYSYFEDIQYIMECEDTPVGCLANAKVVSCSVKGKLLGGYTGSLNKIDTTIVAIETFQTSDCDFTKFAQFVFPTATPWATLTESPAPSPGPSETPTPTYTPTLSPVLTATPKQIPDETPTQSATESPTESPTQTPIESTPLPTPEETPVASLSQTPPQTPSESKSPVASTSPPPSPSQSPSQSPSPSYTPSSSPKATPNIPLILGIVIPSVIVLILLIILLIFCIRKCMDKCQENLLDRGYTLKYNDIDNEETTSDRSNALNIQSESFQAIQSDDEELFSDRPRNRNKYVNQNDNDNDNSSSSL